MSEADLGVQDKEVMQQVFDFYNNTSQEGDNFRQAADLVNQNTQTAQNIANAVENSPGMDSTARMQGRSIARNQGAISDKRRELQAQHIAAQAANVANGGQAQAPAGYVNVGNDVWVDPTNQGQAYNAGSNEFSDRFNP